MDTNINNPKNEADKILGLNRTLFLVIVILLCVLSLCVGIYAQFFYKYSESDPFMLGLVGNAKAEEELKVLESGFDTIFTNELKSNTNNNPTKIDTTKDLIYTSSIVNETSEELYSINANIPVINIDSDTARQMNDDITKTFADEIPKIKGSTDKYKSYIVEYAAFAKDDLLSLAIKSTYYEQEGVQTTTIKTYNYNLAQNQSIDLATVMKARGLTPENVQRDINQKIQNLINDDAEIGYGTVTRDINSDIYKIEKTETFLVSDQGDIYIIYNYGTKKDVLVF